MKCFDYTSALFNRRQLIKCFSIHEQINQFWGHRICKLHQSITSRLVFMIAFEIHCNFYIVLPIWLKTCRSNSFFCFLHSKNCAPKKSRRLRGFTIPNAPDRHRARNLSRLAIAFELSTICIVFEIDMLLLLSGYMYRLSMLVLYY